MGQITTFLSLFVSIFILSFSQATGLFNYARPYAVSKYYNRYASKQLKQFPCDTKYVRNNSSASSVWDLRPQDVGIVASLGDSITAATGSKAKDIFGVLNENRGSSYMTGLLYKLVLKTQGLRL